MYILEDFWYGKVAPGERVICADTEYQQILHQHTKELELFLKDLSPEKLELYDKLESMQSKMSDISEKDVFIVGFRIGVRMILDAIGEYKGSFKN